MNKFLTEYIVSDFAKVQGGYAFKSGDFCNIGIPVIKITNVKERNIDLNKIDHIGPEKCKGLERFYINEGDVLISLTGNGPHCDTALVGRVALFNESSGRYLLNQRVGRFLINEKIVRKNYFYYFISQPAINRLLASHSTGSANQANINASTIEKLSVALPSLETQDKTLKILSTIDIKIELNRKINFNLENLAQTIFKSWFVDFDPVYAKKNAIEAGLTKDQAEQAAIAVIAGICSPIEYVENKDEIEKKLKDKLALIGKEKTEELKKTASLFPSDFEDSEFGNLPTGWTIKSLGDIVTRYKQITKYTKDNVSEFGKTIVFEQGEKSVIGFTENKADFNASTDNPMFIFGDHTCVMKLWSSPFSISSNVIPLGKKDYPAMWTFYACLGKQVFQEYRRHWMEFIIKKTVVPQLEIANMFSQVTTVLHSKMEMNYAENLTLSQLRDTLLPKLLAGEIDLDNIKLEEEQ